MRFAVQHPLSGGYLIFRINDNAPSADTWAEGPSVDTLEQATAIVNTGRKGAGFAATDWIFAPLLVGDFQISNPA
jgi:hypothetical protein